MDIQSLKSNLSKAIDVRESGNLKGSRVLFEKLVEETKKLLKTDSPDNLKDFYITLMGEYVIQYRLEGGAKYFQALEIGKDLLTYDKQNNINNPLALRSVAHPLQNMGNFEEAEIYFRKLIELLSDDAFKQGEELAHYALCVFRQGRLKEAGELIEKAIKQIKNNNLGQKYFNVPYSRALMYKALILSAVGKSKEALELSKEALTIAKKDNLFFRIKQGEKLVEFLQVKKN